MSGRRPGTTLSWNFKQSFRTSILPSNSTGGGTTWQSVPQHFKSAGYLTAGGGKTYHEGLPANFDAPMSWTEPSVGTTKPFSYLPPLYPPSYGGSSYQVCCQQPYDPERGCVSLADAGTSRPNLDLAGQLTALVSRPSDRLELEPSERCGWSDAPCHASSRCVGGGFCKVDNESAMYALSRH